LDVLLENIYPVPQWITTLNDWCPAYDTVTQPHSPGPFSLVSSKRTPVKLIMLFWKALAVQEGVDYSQVHQLFRMLSDHSEGYQLFLRA